MQYLFDTYLTEKDFEFAKSVWAYLETYKKPSFELHKDLHGFTPESVDPLPFESKYGAMPGGYYPLAYDSSKSARAEQNEFTNMAKSQVQSIASKGKQGSTQSRVQKLNRRLDTDFTNVIFGHVSDVIHHVSFDRALYDVGRLLAREQVKKAITDAYGNHIYKQITSMVRTVRDGSEPARHIGERVLLHVRNNATVAMLGASLRTVILQPFGITNSLVKSRMSGIGTMGLVNAYARYMKHPVNASREIRAESVYMNRREEVMSVAISRIKNKIRKRGKFDIVKEWSMIPMMKSQFYSVDAPLYMAARDHFINNGIEREKAIGLAEQVVRDAQGGGGPVDTAEAMQGGAGWKTMTNFLTYMITTYSLQSENYQRTKRGDQSVFDFTVNMVVLLTMPAVLTHLLNELARGGDDDEEWYWSLAKEQASFMLSMTPFTAQFSGLAQGYDYTGPQGLSIISKTGQLAKQIGQGEMDDALLKSGIWFGGLALGLPAAQANRSIFGAKQAIEENDDPLTTVKKTALGPVYK